MATFTEDFAGAAGPIPGTQIGADDLERNGSGQGLAGSSGNVCATLYECASTTQQVEITLGNIVDEVGAFIGALVFWDDVSGDGYQVDCTIGSPTININVWDNFAYVEGRSPGITTDGGVNFATGDKIRVTCSVLGNGNPSFTVYHTPAAGGGEDLLDTFEDTDSGSTPTGNFVGMMIYTDNAPANARIDHFTGGDQGGGGGGFQAAWAARSTVTIIGGREV